MAFSWDGEAARFHIYVKLLDEERPLRLTQDPAEDSFSGVVAGRQADCLYAPPDGLRIRYHADPVDWRTGTNSAPDPSRVLRQRIRENDGLVCRWKVALLHQRTWPIKSPRAVSVVSRFRQCAVVLRAIRKPEGYSSPAFSPYGSWLAFARYASSYNSKIFFQHVTAKLEPDGEPLVVTNTSGNSTTPVWLPDSKHIVFLDHDGRRIMVAPIGGTAKLAYIASASLSGLTLDRRGLRLIA